MLHFSNERGPPSHPVIYPQGISVVMENVYLQFTVCGHSPLTAAYVAPRIRLEYDWLQPTRIRPHTVDVPHEDVLTLAARPDRRASPSHCPWP